MGCITAFLFLCNIALIVGVDAFLWTHSATMRLLGIVGIIAFFIAYALSVEITIAPRDFWANSEFDVFIKKLSFANTTALIVWGGSIFIASACGNESVADFLNWLSN